MGTNHSSMTIMAWGTYDTGKPRVRILLRGLRENHVYLTECHYHVWQDVEDKTQLRGVLNKLKRCAKWLISYPKLIKAFLLAEKQDAVLIGYFGYLDILVLWPFARLKRTPIILDAFIPLYDTLVNDREMLNKHNPIAWLAWVWEWLALKAADKIIFDTKAHQDYFCQEFSISSEKCSVVFVGVEPEFFRPEVTAFEHNNSEDSIVLFYGQLIPLHGVETIIEAARLSEKEKIKWVIIGSGQEAKKVEKLLLQYKLNNVEWIKWVDYEALNSWINKADICLGIFGSSEKAARVIPNKVYQIIAAEKPLVTRASPAMSELLRNNTFHIRLIRHSCGHSLLESTKDLLVNQYSPSNNITKIQPKYLGSRFIKFIAN